MQCKYLPIRLCSLWPDRRLSQVFLFFFVHSNLLSSQQEIPRDGVQYAKPCYRDAAQRPWSWVLSVDMHWQPGRWYDANLRDTTGWSLPAPRMLHMPLGAISITFARKIPFTDMTRYDNCDDNWNCKCSKIGLEKVLEHINIFSFIILGISLTLFLSLHRCYSSGERLCKRQAVRFGFS